MGNIARITAYASIVSLAASMLTTLPASAELGSRQYDLAQSNQIAPPSEEQAPVYRGAPRAGEDVYDEARWRSYAEGKTLYYTTAFGLVGKEYYPPNSNRVVYVRANGTCVDGDWSFKDDIFCFEYQSQHCFFHIERDGVVYARHIDGVEQTVSQVTDEILSCAPINVSDAGAPAMRAAAKRKSEQTR